MRPRRVADAGSEGAEGQSALDDFAVDAVLADAGGGDEALEDGLLAVARVGNLIRTGAAGAEVPRRLARAIIRTVLVIFLRDIVVVRNWRRHVGRRRGAVVVFLLGRRGRRCRPAADATRTCVEINQ